MATHFDYLLVGGGLQNALIALAVRSVRPTARICMVEREHSVGGNHLWSFHPDDLPPAAQAFIAPLIVHQWPAVDVRFPAWERRFELPYASISSERLDEVVRQRILIAGSELRTGTRVVEVRPHEATLADGRTLGGEVVVDSRGPSAVRGLRHAGYQKFVGLELDLLSPWPQQVPLLMDATVEQVDGFRFAYVLPLTPTRVLVEDTYFSAEPRLDTSAVRMRALAWATGAGMRVRDIVREERGVLPLPGQVPKVDTTLPLRGGYAGGWFHPTTGYSLTAAARLASHIASTEPKDLFGPAYVALASAQRRQLWFATVLNNILFGAVGPQMRRNVFEHFHRRSPELIARFYALQTTPGDLLELLKAGPPPGVSLRVALENLRESVAREAIAP